MLVINETDLNRLLHKKFQKIQIKTTRAIVKKLLLMNFTIEIIPNFKTILHKNVLFHVYTNL